MSDGLVTQNAWVTRVLGLQFDGTAAMPEAGGNLVRLAKGLLLWNGTRSYVAQQVKALQQAILAAAADEPDFPEIAANIGNLETLLEWLDDRLTLTMDALRLAADPAEKARLSEQARGIVRDYQAQLAASELVNDIADNGFLPLDIKARMTASLKAVLDTI